MRMNSKAAKVLMASRLNETHTTETLKEMVADLRSKDEGGLTVYGAGNILAMTTFELPMSGLNYLFGIMEVKRTTDKHDKDRYEGLVANTIEMMLK